MVAALAIAALAASLAVLGEWLHARRVARVARLAFGAIGKPSAWATATPFIRVLGIALATWGAVTLANYDPAGGDQTPSPRASRQVLIALDVSPSMLIKDAGPEAEKVTRSQRAGALVQGVLDRLDMKETRITMVAFYTKAITVLQDTTDKNVISNMFDGLQLHVAFQQGPTDLATGVNAALEVARPWARNSTTLIVISDGDGKSTLSSIRVPQAIADTIVIGVGDPNKPTVVSGHSSKQDSWALKQLAARLQGHYHEGNRLHIPSSLIDKLAMIKPNKGVPLGLRDAALIAVGAGCSLIGLIGPALMWAGLRRSYVKEQRRGVRVVQTQPSAVALRA